MENTETIKTIPLNDATQKIFDRFAELSIELQETMPEDFEAKAAIYGEMQGIKFVIDLLSETNFF